MAKFGAVLFSVDFDPLRGPNPESNECQAGTVEEFEKIKMASKMAADSGNGP